MIRVRGSPRAWWGAASRSRENSEFVKQDVPKNFGCGSQRFGMRSHAERLIRNTIRAKSADGGGRGSAPPRLGPQRARRYGMSRSQVATAERAARVVADIVGDACVVLCPA